MSNLTLVGPVSKLKAVTVTSPTEALTSVSRKVGKVYSNSVVVPSPLYVCSVSAIIICTLREQELNS